MLAAIAAAFVASSAEATDSFTNLLATESAFTASTTSFNVDVIPVPSLANLTVITLLL